MNKGKFKFSVIIPIFILITGLCLHFTQGLIRPEWFSFPVNLIIGLELFCGIPLVYFFFKNKKAVQFLSSGAAAISAISLFAFLTTIMAVLPQEKPSYSFIEFSGLNNIVFTWYFTLSALYILICLGFVILRRFNAFSLRNIVFFINHFGLWLVIVTGFLGQADKIKLNIPVAEGSLVWYGFDPDNKYFEPGFAIKLTDFKIEYYNPKIGVFNSDGELTGKTREALSEIKQKDKIKAGNYDVEILEILQYASVSGDSVYAVTENRGAVTAVRLKLSDDKNSFEKWIYTGNKMVKPGIIATGTENFIALIPPEPKYFGSDIEFYTRSGISAEPHNISVNKPLKYYSWTIYQSSYYSDPESGNIISVFSAVYDPWLPFTYAGMFMLISGAVFMMFTKIRTVKKD